MGIALSRENIAFAQSVIARTDIITFLKRYFQENKETEDIIVGLPYDLYGKKIIQLEKTQKFIEKLKDIFPEKNII